MPSLRRREGYLEINHRFSPGTSEVPGGTVLEAATITCSHCQTVLIVNPLRNRERGYCGKCDHYVCDGCEAVRVSTGECRTMAKVFDELEKAVHRDIAPQFVPAARSLVLTDVPSSNLCLSKDSISHG